MNKQPSKEEIKEFWERCGFFQQGFFIPADKIDWWFQPDKVYCPKGELPPADLNNLFKYAVPKLDQAKYFKALGSISLKQEDPALALFWAIWEVISGR